MTGNLLSGRVSLVQVRHALVAAMMFGISIDMGGEFGVRNPLVFGAVASLILLNGLRIPKASPAVVAFFVGWPLLLLAYGVAMGGDIEVGASQLASTVFAAAFFIAVFRIEGAALINALFGSLTITAAVAILLFVGVLIDVSFGAKLQSRLAELGGGFFGEREVGEQVLPNVYFKATLFLLPAFVYWLWRGRTSLAAVCLVGLLVQVSKAGLLLAALVILVRVVAVEGFLRRLQLFAIAGVLCVLGASMGYWNLLESVTSGHSLTLQVRLGHLNSVLGLFADAPWSLLVGFGLGSTFYTSGFDLYVSNIELDHLNTIRKYGLVWTSLFFGGVIVVAIRAIRAAEPHVNVMGYCLLVAFVVAGTNPVLLSPPFFALLMSTYMARRDAQYQSMRAIGYVQRWSLSA
jgi:hypothetical protein